MPSDQIDISKIKVGDKLTVRVKVASVPENGVIVGYNPGPCLWITASDIISHTPKALEVGDRVKYATNPDSIQGVVQAVNERLAWVRWNGTREPFDELENLEGLERLDAQ